MTSFRLAFHLTTGRTIVEVLDERGQVISSIYPTDNNAIHIVSRHFDGKPKPPAETSMLHALLRMESVQSYLIKFNREKPRT